MYPTLTLGVYGEMSAINRVYRFTVSNVQCLYLVITSKCIRSHFTIIYFLNIFVKFFNFELSHTKYGMMSFCDLKLWIESRRATSLTRIQFAISQWSFVRLAPRLARKRYIRYTNANHHFQHVKYISDQFINIMSLIWFLHIASIWHVTCCLMAFHTSIFTSSNRLAFV